MRYFIRFAYNGTSFHGSQTQPNGITVQQTLEQALTTILRQPIALTFAGRTDAGVHALEMFAHFDFPSPMDATAPMTEGLDKIVSRLNSLLPASIAVRSLFPVSDDAHARFSAIARTYRYCLTEWKDPFNIHLSTTIAPGLDYERMNQAAQLLLGTHDFASFCKVHTDVKTTRCTVSSASFITHEHGAEFTITADRFLRNMVRAIVGTLLEVGRHRMSLTDFQAVLDARNRCAAGQSAAPDGLYLVKIEYPQTIVSSIRTEKQEPDRL